MLFATIYSFNNGKTFKKDKTFNYKSFNHDTFREIPINVKPGDNVEGFWTGDKLITIPKPESEIKLSLDSDGDESEKKVRRRYKKPRSRY